MSTPPIPAPSGIATLVELLRWRADIQPDAVALTFLADGEQESDRLTYGAIDRQARVIAVNLRARDVTCAGCGFLVEALLRESPGVAGYEVDFLHGEAYLEYDADRTSLRAA